MRLKLNLLKKESTKQLSLTTFFKWLFKISDEYVG